MMLLNPFRGLSLSSFGQLFGRNADQPRHLPVAVLHSRMFSPFDHLPPPTSETNSARPPADNAAVLRQPQRTAELERDRHKSTLASTPMPAGTDAHARARDIVRAAKLPEGAFGEILAAVKLAIAPAEAPEDFALAVANAGRKRRGEAPLERLPNA